jgi:hypothetical protein
MTMSAVAEMDRVGVPRLGRRQFLKKEEDTKTDNHDEENEKAHANDQLFLANVASHRFPQIGGTDQT